MKLQTMNEKGQDWGDFVNRYTSQSSRHSSPDREHDFMRLTPSPISPLFSSAEKQFCRRDNIDQCLAYLNQVGKMWRDDSVFDAYSLVLSIGKLITALFSCMQNAIFFHFLKYDR